MPVAQMETAAELAVIDALLPQCRAGLAAAEVLLESARTRLSAVVTPAGKIDAQALDTAKFAAHGFAWLATYVEAQRQLLD